MMLLPEHLGGHCNRTHLDEGVLDFLIQNYHISSMLDVGCATGGMVELAKSKGLRAHGIEGDHTINFVDPTAITVHDFTTGPALISDSFDLVWCCAFVEHVEERFVENFMAAFRLGKIVIMTYYELPGHHHVNLKPPSYWISVMHQNGFTHDFDLTQQIRTHTTMGQKGARWSKKAWIRHYGLAFVKS